VETAKILNANVTAAKLAANAVTPTAIAANAVETAKILDLNVTTGKLADAAVTTVKLANNSVATAKIVDTAVTLAKLESVLSAYVLAGTGAGVAAASIGGVLTATYAAGVLTFAFANTTAAAGSLKYIRLDEKANSGVGCGASAAATWVQNRGGLTAWNEVDAAEQLTLTSGGMFSLKAGTYSIRAFAPGNDVGLHQLRLRKITATAATVLEGGAVNSPVGTQGMALLQGMFTVAADADEYALQHWTTAAIAVDGLGQSATTGEKSVFASIELLKIA